MVKLIVIGSNRPALVDDEFAHLVRYRWRTNKYGRVFRHGDRVIFLNHVIMGDPPAGFVIAQNSGDRLDCRRENLKLVTCDELRRNPNWRASNKTGVRGVYFDKSRGKYVATVRHNNRNYNLGRYSTLEEATQVVSLKRPEILSIPAVVSLT